jgi:hypothetical protein
MWSFRVLPSFLLEIGWELRRAPSPSGSEFLPAGFTATSAAGTESTVSGAASLRFGSRFIHIQGASVHFLPIQLGDRFGGSFIAGHFHEREAAGAACVSVRHHLDPRDLSEWFEQRCQVAIRGLETQVSDKQISHFLLLNLPQRRSDAV